MSNKYIKNGPPITDNIIPTGITIGANNILPAVSAISINKDPKIAEQGINFR